MSLVVIQVPTMGSAYKALSLLAEGPQTSVYDMIPHGYGATLLVKAVKENVETALKNARVEYSIDGQLTGDEEKVLRALYSIDNSALKESLLVVESVNPGVLLEVGFEASQVGLEIVDIKIPRGAQVTGSVLLTGSEQQVQNFQSGGAFLRRKVQTTYVAVTPALEKFFDISPKN